MSTIAQSSVLRQEAKILAACALEMSEGRLPSSDLEAACEAFLVIFREESPAYQEYVSELVERHTGPQMELWDHEFFQEMGSLP